MKKLSLFVILFGFLLLFNGCEEEKIVTKIEVNQSFDTINIDDFYYDDVMVKVTYEDGETEEVPLNKSWISESDYRNMFHPGIKIINITYQNHKAKLIFRITTSPLYETLRYYHQVLLSLDKTDLSYEAFMMSHKKEDTYIDLIEANEAGHLIITYKDDSTKDLGYIQETHEVAFYDTNHNLIETTFVFHGFNALSPGMKNERYKDSNWSRTLINIDQDVDIYEVYTPVDIIVSLILNHTTNHNSYVNSILVAFETYNSVYGTTASIYTVYGPTRDHYMDTVEHAIINGSQLIILEDFLFDSVAHELQYLYPSVKFIIIEGTPTSIINFDTYETYDGAPPSYELNENLINIHFKVQEGGFLAGYTAVKDGHETLGFIGGLPIPTIVRYGIGFVAGAYYAAHEMTNHDFYFEPAHFDFTYEFGSSNTAYYTARDFYHSGVDLIFAVAGRGVEAMINAADEFENKWIINADDHVPSYHILGVINKDLTYPLVDIMVDNYFGEFHGGMTHIMGMTEQAFILNIPDPNKFTLFTDTDYELINQKLRNGEIDVPNTVEALESFIQSLGYDGYNIIDKINQFI